MSKGGTKQTTVQNSDPWSAAQPLLRKGLDEASRLFESGELTPQPFGPTLPDESPYSRMSREWIASNAMAGNPVIPAATNAYMGAMNFRPDLEGVRENVLRQAVPQAASYFENSGMLNSNVAAEGIGEAASRALAPVEYGAYENAANRAMTGAQMAPTMAGLQYNDAQMLGAVGAQEDARRQAEAQEAARAYYEAEDTDFSNLQRISQLGMGFGGMGGTSTGFGRTKEIPSAMETFGSIMQTVGPLMSMFAMSDRRTKENIEKVGTTTAEIPVYKFNYKGDKTPQVGVMADEVPDSITRTGPMGFKMVDYSKIGV